MDDFDLSHKTVFITGASSGIGEAAAYAFAKAGANVVLAARRQAELQRIAKDIGPQATAIALDVSDYAAVEAAIQKTHQNLGSLDVLINNAGVIAPISRLSLSDPHAWGQIIDINLKGMYHSLRAAAPLMKAQGAGSVLNISSGAALRPLEGWSAYCASKAGALMLTQSADLELRAHGIRVLGLSPGTVATQMQKEIKESGLNPVSQLDWSDHIPPDWVATALIWMTTKDADPYLGQDISLRDPRIRQILNLSR